MFCINIFIIGLIISVVGTNNYTNLKFRVAKCWKKDTHKNALPLHRYFKL